MEYRNDIVDNWFDENIDIAPNEVQEKEAPVETSGKKQNNICSNVRKAAIKKRGPPTEYRETFCITEDIVIL